MLRVSRRTLSVVVTLLLASAASVPVRAVGPAFVMFYGGDLEAPVIVGTTFNTSFIWSPLNGGVSWGSRTPGTLPPGLEGRPYVHMAIFWGRYDRTSMKPGDASQHGRYYPASGTAPGAIVITAPNMAHPTDPNANPEPRQIPTSVEEFYAGWTTSSDMDMWMRQWASVDATGAG